MANGKLQMADISETGRSGLRARARGVFAAIQTVECGICKISGVGEEATVWGCAGQRQAPEVGGVTWDRGECLHRARVGEGCEERGFQKFQLTQGLVAGRAFQLNGLAGE